MRTPAKRRQPAEGMKAYKGYVSIGLVGCKREFTFEVEEDASEKDIEDIAREVMFDNIEWSFAPVDETAQ